ncbi:hypothetical protein VNO78_32701 [Psophocarpus tetragonolobus]|uniref:Uncharacterized protein n=1 Tax=Psophocarpus tetragonolobus TaxID=3891 RepID=A0AAN9NVQ2_PSOTE
MMKQVLFLFCFASAITLSVSESKVASVHPHAVESFSVGLIQMMTQENCSYMVVISTSCESPKHSTDKIGITFGDAHGNQIYAPTLNDPFSSTFERCSSDSFQIDGACASPICYMYLFRNGNDETENAWQPESVKIYGYNSGPVTFTFNSSIPNGTWYGYNLCEVPSPPSSSSYQLSPLKCLKITLFLAFVLSFWF